MVELLEIPQLIDACTRNGFYDEALELSLFINSLERKYILTLEIKHQEEQEQLQQQQLQQQQFQQQQQQQQENNENNLTSIRSLQRKKINNRKNIIQNIVNDVHKTLSDLRGQLLQKLSEEAALPKLLTILSSLRKLDGIIIDRKISIDHYNKSFFNFIDHNNNNNKSNSSDGNSSNNNSNSNNNTQYENLSKYIETSLQMSYLEARTIWIQRMI